MKNSNKPSIIEFIQVILLVAVAIYIVSKALFQVIKLVYERFLKSSVDEAKNDILVHAEAMSEIVDNAIMVHFTIKYQVTISQLIDIHSELAEGILEVAYQIVTYLPKLPNYEANNSNIVRLMP